MQRTISINTLSLPPASFDVQVDQVARLGVAAISPTLEEVVAFGTARARRILDDSGLSVATFTHRAFAYATPEAATNGQERLTASLLVAREIGADSITMTTGGRDRLAWPEAAERFVQAVAPCADHAREIGVRLAIEPTSHLYADVSIALRLTDTVALARKAGIHLGIDLFACWFDADIEPAIDHAAPLCAVVQVSDVVMGDRALPCRAVPGDGVIPLGRLLSRILAGGYDGYFDIEFIGPRIAAEGADKALKRAVARIEAILAP